MDKLKFGAEQAINYCMSVKSSDNVLIIGDKDSKKVVTALENAARNKTNKIKIYFLEDFGKRPILTPPKELIKAVKWCTASFYTAEFAPGEDALLSWPLLQTAVSKKGARQAHMPGINVEQMKTGMCADYKKIDALSKKVYDLVKNAKEIRVTTKLGTDITANFSKKLKWIISDGRISKSFMKWGNLPSGEVFTCPADVNGTFICDGVLGDWLGPKYGFMNKHPLIVEIENGRVVGTSCSNKKLLKDFNKYIKQEKYADRIGEFAIGTNIGLKKFVGNLLQDEKFPGIHIAAGDSYHAYTGSDWECGAHCDMVIKKANIFIDGKQIMKEGMFLI